MFVIALKKDKNIQKEAGFGPYLKQKQVKLEGR